MPGTGTATAAVHTWCRPDYTVQQYTAVPVNADGTAVSTDVCYRERRGWLKVVVRDGPSLPSVC